MSAFWLLCSITLAATTYIQESETTASSLLQSLGLISLIFSWALGPKLFLQPLKASIKSPVQKPLALGLVVFFAFQLASLVARHMV
ncbi:hypothetical protein D9M70_312280 [compost metagenome]